LMWIRLWIPYHVTVSLTLHTVAANDGRFVQCCLRFRSLTLTPPDPRIGEQRAFCRSRTSPRGFPRGFQVQGLWTSRCCRTSRLMTLIRYTGYSIDRVVLLITRCSLYVFTKRTLTANNTFEYQACRAVDARSIYHPRYFAVVGSSSC
jgi:hypothetical protein